jgi:hypothetical protein
MRRRLPGLLPWLWISLNWLSKILWRLYWCIHLILDIEITPLTLGSIWVPLTWIRLLLHWNWIPLTLWLLWNIWVPLTWIRLLLRCTWIPLTLWLLWNIWVPLTWIRLLLHWDWIPLTCWLLRNIWVPLATTRLRLGYQIRIKLIIIRNRSTNNRLIRPRWSRLNWILILAKVSPLIYWLIGQLLLSYLILDNR